MKHAIADESAAVADQHADLAQLLRKLHAGGDHFGAGGFAAHDFEQPHHVRGAEEVRADDAFGARDVADAISSMFSVDVLVARIAPGLQTLVEFARRSSFFSAIPSKTASMTMSTLSKAVVS